VGPREPITSAIDDIVSVTADCDEENSIPLILAPHLPAFSTASHELELLQSQL
jgi:hypothetical protein